MFYPENFKKRVKEVYPDWEELHQALERGDRSVGSCLDSSELTGISLNAILEATSLEELQKQARAQQEQIELYGEWVRLFKKQSAY